MKNNKGILDGVRVLDLGRVLAGPFCAQILGDLGAEIIKVERPDGGDDTRAWKPPEVGGEAAYFFAVNRNKKSLTLDMATPRGQEILHGLAKVSDVVIENFRPGVAKRLNVDYATLSALNPRLIYCSISGFGQEGPMAGRAAYDYVIQAMSGLMSITGEPDGMPVRCGGAVADYPTGLWATVSVLAALMARQQTDRGQHIDLSMHDCTLLLMSHIVSQFLASGDAPPRVGNGHGNIVPMNVYDTADAPLMVLCGNDAMFRRLAAAIGRPEVADDPDFAENLARAKNQDRLHEIVGAALSADTRDNWIVRFQEANVPIAPIRSLPEVFEAPEVLDRNMVMEIPHPTAGTIKAPGSPLKFSDTPIVEPSHPPLLGEHSETLLRDLLDMDDTAIAELRATGIVG